MSDATLKRFLLHTSCAAAAVLLFTLTLRCLLPWLLPFLLAAGAAALIEPAVRFLQRRLRFRRGFSSLLLTLFLLFVLGGLSALLGTALTGEASALLARAPALLAAIPRVPDALLERVDGCESCPPWLRHWIADSLARLAGEAGGLLDALLARVPGLLASLAAALPRLFLAVATTVLAIYFTSSSWPELRVFYRRRIPVKTRERLKALQSGMERSLARWLRAELTLCCLTFAELLAGFVLLRQPYALLLAFLITLVDALPVFGTGTVLLPWAAAELLLQNAPKAVSLSALYLVTLAVRNVLEPRLLGTQAGLPPIASLLAMYLGFRSFGVAGMVLFPFLLLLAAQLRRQNASQAGLGA